MQHIGNFHTWCASKILLSINVYRKINCWIFISQNNIHIYLYYVYLSHILLDLVGMVRYTYMYLICAPDSMRILAEKDLRFFMIVDLLLYTISYVWWSSCSTIYICYQCYISIYIYTYIWRRGGIQCVKPVIYFLKFVFRLPVLVVNIFYNP